MHFPRPVCIANLTTATTVCSAPVIANTPWTRMKGLLGKGSLDEMAGLLILPSSSVHTVAMRFAIDVVALDRELRVTAIRENVVPGRLCLLGRATHSVLELKSGRISRCSLSVGDQLSLQPMPATSA